MATRDWRVCYYKGQGLATKGNARSARWVFDDLNPLHLNDLGAMANCAAQGRNASGDVYMAPLQRSGRVQWVPQAARGIQVDRYFAELYSGNQVDELLGPWNGQRNVGAPIINVSPNIPLNNLAIEVKRVCEAALSPARFSGTMGIYDYEPTGGFTTRKLSAIVSGLNACTGSQRY